MPSVRSADVQKSLEHYEVGRTLGEGTFGTVKLGIHRLTKEKVAIKILEKSRIKDEADARRVAREINILRKVRHRNVIQLFEVIVAEDKILLIMEYSDHGELFNFIVKEGRLREQQACRFLHDILDGLDYLHSLGVTHRDLKPENVLLQKAEGTYKAKVIDFGLSNMTTPGSLLTTACGSPCYAAPEMIAGHPYNGNLVDIWSMGVVLYAMVCGCLPFEDQSTSRLYDKILGGKYELPNHLSKGCRYLIRRILETEPRKRYTAAQIRADPWYNMMTVPPSPVKTVPRTVSELHPMVTTEIQRLGFSLDATAEATSKQMHNQVTTTYYLLVARAEREHNASSYGPMTGRQGAPTGRSSPRHRQSSDRRSATRSSSHGNGRRSKHRSASPAVRHNPPSTTSTQAGSGRSNTPIINAISVYQTDPAPVAPPPDARGRDTRDNRDHRAARSRSERRGREAEQRGMPIAYAEDMRRPPSFKLDFSRLDGQEATAAPVQHPASARDRIRSSRSPRSKPRVGSAPRSARTGRSVSPRVGYGEPSSRARSFRYPPKTRVTGADSQDGHQSVGQGSIVSVETENFSVYSQYQGGGRGSSHRRYRSKRSNRDSGPSYRSKSRGSSGRTSKASAKGYGSYDMNGRYRRGSDDSTVGSAGQTAAKRANSATPSGHHHHGSSGPSDPTSGRPSTSRPSTRTAVASTTASGSSGGGGSRDDVGGGGHVMHHVAYGNAPVAIHGTAHNPSHAPAFTRRGAGGSRQPVRVPPASVPSDDDAATLHSKRSDVSGTRSRVQVYSLDFGGQAEDAASPSMTPRSGAVTATGFATGSRLPAAAPSHRAHQPDASSASAGPTRSNRSGAPSSVFHRRTNTGEAEAINSDDDQYSTGVAESDLDAPHDNLHHFRSSRSNQDYVLPVSGHQGPAKPQERTTLSPRASPESDSTGPSGGGTGGTSSVVATSRHPHIKVGRARPARIQSAVRPASQHPAPSPELKTISIDSAHVALGAADHGSSATLDSTEALVNATHIRTEPSKPQPPATVTSHTTAKPAPQSPPAVHRPATAVDRPHRPVRARQFVAASRAPAATADHGATSVSATTTTTAPVPVPQVRAPSPRSADHSANTKVALHILQSQAASAQQRPPSTQPRKPHTPPQQPSRPATSAATSGRPQTSGFNRRFLATGNYGAAHGAAPRTHVVGRPTTQASARRGLPSNLDGRLRNHPYAQPQPVLVPGARFGSPTSRGGRPRTASQASSRLSERHGSSASCSSSEVERTSAASEHGIAPVVVSLDRPQKSSSPRSQTTSSGRQRDATGGSASTDSGVGTPALASKRKSGGETRGVQRSARAVPGTGGAGAAPTNAPTPIGLTGTSANAAPAKPTSPRENSHVMTNIFSVVLSER